jgi:hypothetical protein
VRERQRSVLLEVDAQVEALEEFGSQQRTASHRHDGDIDFPIIPVDNNTEGRNRDITTIGKIRPNTPAGRELQRGDQGRRQRELALKSGIYDAVDDGVIMGRESQDYLDSRLQVGDYAVDHR